LVTNRGCAALSNPTLIQVKPLPIAEILNPDLSTSFCAGTNLTLLGFAQTGYSYQWKLNGINISGANSSTYNTSSAGVYTLSTSQNGCSAISKAISTSQLPLPSANITTSGSLTFCSGGSVTFSASTGLGYSYQWFLNDQIIPNATRKMENQKGWWNRHSFEAVEIVPTRTSFPQLQPR
jgi:hypothetical protein